MAYTFSKSRLSLLSAVALAALMVSSPVFAGFEWRGPLAPPAPPPQAAAPAAPVMNTEMNGLEPVITWNGQTPSQVPDQMPAVPFVPVEQASVAQVAAPLAAAPFDGDMGDVVEGFGSNVPLVIALQQIAPAGFRVSFLKGVNPGVNVSWQGGKPWKVVLAETLAPVGLASRIDDNNTLVLLRADAAPVLPKASVAEVAPEFVPETVPVETVPVDATSVVAAETAPVALGAPENGGRVLIGHASETGAKTSLPPSASKAPDVAAPVTTAVEIRREKPKSFLDRLGLWAQGEKSGQDAWGNKGGTPPAAKKAADVPVKAEAPKVVAEVEALPPPMPVDEVEKSLAESLPEEGVKPVADAVAAPIPLQYVESVAQEPVLEPVLDSAPEEVVSESVAPAVTPLWRGEKGQTLRSVLKKWSDTAGVEMYWSVDYDYKLDDAAAFSGTYDEAVADILQLFSAASPQPYGNLHQSTDGPRVLVIKIYEPAG